MQGFNLSVVILASKNMLDELPRPVFEKGKEQWRIVQRKNLGGDAPTWMLAGTLSLQAITLILEHLRHKATLQSKQKVSKITIGDIEVENPSAELLQQLTEQIKKRFNTK